MLEELHPIYYTHTSTDTGKSTPRLCYEVPRGLRLIAFDLVTAAVVHDGCRLADIPRAERWFMGGGVACATQRSCIAVQRQKLVDTEYYVIALLCCSEYE